jgi:hypothetical protein
MPCIADSSAARLRRPTPGATVRFALSVSCVLLMGNTMFSCSSNNGDLLVAGSNGEADNGAPVARSFTIEADEDVPTEDTLRASDPDGDRLTFRIVSGPVLGDVDLLDAETGAFTYTAVLSGVDSFTYVASDGRHDSNAATVTVQIDMAAATAPSGESSLPALPERATLARCATFFGGSSTIPAPC